MPTKYDDDRLVLDRCLHPHTALTLCTVNPFLCVQHATIIAAEALAASK